MKLCLLLFLLLFSCSSKGEEDSGVPSLLQQKFIVEPNLKERKVSVKADLSLRCGNRPLSQFYVYLTSAAELKNVSSSERQLSWEPRPAFIPFFNAVSVNLRNQIKPGETFRISLHYVIKQEAKQTGLGALSMCIEPEFAYLFESWIPSVQPLLDNDGFVQKVPKAPFELKILVEPSLTGLSTGVSGPSHLEGGKRIFCYSSEEAPPLLIPLVIGRFKVTHFPNLEIPIEVYAKERAPSAFRDFVAFVAKAALIQARVLERKPPKLIRIVFLDTGGLARGFPTLLVLPPSMHQGWWDA